MTSDAATPGGRGGLGGPNWPAWTIPTLLPERGYESTATAEVRPRYEDIVQDGRMQLTSLMPGLGSVWRTLGGSPKSPLASLRAQGILPILRRLVIVGEDGPFTIQASLQVSGTWRLARETGGDRLLLDMWLEVRAPKGQSLAPPPPPDAPLSLVGRIYAEHVITRPFAPRDERKVTRLDVPGLPAVPEDEHPLEDVSALLAGHPLEPAPHEHTFGMMHTDPNQHVNSLAYPRIFEEVALRHVAARGISPAPQALLARALDVRYRKPFFAGDRAAMTLHAERLEAPAPGAAGVGPVGAVGAFAPAGAPAGTPPSCTIAERLA